MAINSEKISTSHPSMPVWILSLPESTHGCIHPEADAGGDKDGDCDGEVEGDNEEAMTQPNGAECHPKNTRGKGTFF